MENKVLVYTSVKADEELKGSEVKIALTLDFEGYTPEDYQTKAAGAATIQWATSVRKKGQAYIEALNGKATFKVPKPGTRAMAQMLPFDALVMVCGGNKELALSIVTKAGSVEAALALFKEVLADYEGKG